MTASVWPNYRGFAFRDLAMLARFVANPAHIRSVATVAILIAIYVGGLFTRIPGLATNGPAHIGDQWWFLSFADLVLTGGALGRGSVFSLGVLGPMILGLTPGKTPTLMSWIRKGLSLILCAAFVGFSLRARGLVAQRPKALVLACLIVACGGIVLRFINAYIVRRRGPGIFYINLFLVLYASLRTTFVKLTILRQYWAIAVAAGCILLIAVSAYFLMRARVWVDIQNVQDIQQQRRARLEIPGIDEALVDALGAICLMLYIGFAGVISIIFGWHVITVENQLVFSILSAGVFALVWAFFTQVEKHSEILETMGGLGMFGITDPRGYALRMLNSFWIIPGTKAGRETEAQIKTKLTRVFKRSFFLFVSWFGATAALQYGLARTAPSAVLFPFGPLAFIFILIMLVANVSAIWRHLSGALNRFKQLLRGQSRVVAGMYPLGKADQRGRISLDQDFQQYWEEERISEHLHDVLEWVNIVNDFQLTPKAGRTRIGGLWATLLQLTLRLLAGVVIAFIVGLACLLLFPDLSQKDMALVILPVLVTTVIVPEAIMKVMGWSARRGAQAQ